MFGKNIVMKQYAVSTGVYNVREIFRTIQGEGPFVGLPATFVRFNGCNLRCHFCDTDFDAVTLQLFAGEILDACFSFKNKLIVLTGGEPLLQRIEPLITRLMDNGFDVQVETAGTVELLYSQIPWHPTSELTVVVSPKTSALHPAILSCADYYKYLIKLGETDSHDGLPVTNTQDTERRHIKLARPPLHFPRDKIFLQPLDETHISAAHTKENIQETIRLCMDYGYRLSLQMHKTLGLP